MTLENLIALEDYEQNRNGHDPGGEPYIPAPAGSLFKRASDVSSRIVKWGWKGRLPLGYITIQTGEEGLGKSVFAAWLAARATRGELDGNWYGSPVDVLIVAGEDGLQDTWKPRLEVASADLDRVSFLSLDELPPDWNVRDGIGALRQVLVETHAQLVVVDALLDHMPAPHGGENINSAPFVRSALAPLKSLANELNVVALISLHPPKSRGASFRDLVQASQAFAAVPRTGLVFGWHPDDAEDDPNRRRVLLRGKGNLGRNPGALEFRVEGRELQHADGCWDEREVVTDVLPSDMTLRRLLARERPGQGDGAPSKVEQAAEITREQLADHEWHPGALIRDVLHKRYLNHNQTVRDAKTLAGVETRQAHGTPHGGWEWRLCQRSDQAASSQNQGQGHKPSPMTLTPERARIPNNHGQNHQNHGLGTDDSDLAPPGDRCSRHPTAGRWRIETSDYWMCSACYPPSGKAAGAVTEPASSLVEGNAT